MPKGQAFAGEILKVIFWNYPIIGICDAAASPYAQLYISLHTSDPTSVGSQTDGEISYTPYARVAMVRGTSVWAINNNIVSPKNPIIFPQMTGGNGGLASYWVVGTSHSGSGKILYIGSVTPAIGVAVGVQPQFDITTVIAET